MKRKYLGDVNKNYIKTFTSKVIRIDNEFIKGYASLINVIEVNRPLVVNLEGTEICLYNNGYSELGFLPDNENWMVWTLYDDFGKIIEWYVDITRINSVDEEGRPFCDDMFLDIVLQPNGKTIILDEDELLDGKNKGLITEKEFNLAYQVKHSLFERKFICVEYMEKLCGVLKKEFSKWNVDWKHGHNFV